METNIVEVENFVQQTEERRVSAFAKEVKRYLETYPDTQYVDVLLTDLNGCFRGKRIPVAGLSKLEKGCYFPASVFAMDILGNVVEEAGLGQDMGEPDRSCIPGPGTLTPSAADPQSIAQVQLPMVDEDGAPFDVEPRNVLNRLWQQLRQRAIQSRYRCLAAAVGATGQVNIVIANRFFDYRCRHRLVQAVAQSDKRLALVDFCRVNQSVNLVMLHHRFNLFSCAIQHHHLAAVVNRDLNKTACLELAIGKNLTLLGGVSDIEFHGYPRKKAPAEFPRQRLNHFKE